MTDRTTVIFFGKTKGKKEYEGTFYLYINFSFFLHCKNSGVKVTPRVL